jgi:hypothetical protein
MKYKIIPQLIKVSKWMLLTYKSIQIIHKNNKQDNQEILIIKVINKIECKYIILNNLHKGN